MERLSRGIVNEQGLVFWGYLKSAKNGEYWVDRNKFNSFSLKKTFNQRQRGSKKLGRIKKLLNNAKQRAKKENLDFNLDNDYLVSICVDVCPILHIDLEWDILKGKVTDFSPSLDKVKPELGYVKGNVQWISALANRMKSNANSYQLKEFAKWIMLNIKD